MEGMDEPMKVAGEAAGEVAGAGTDAGSASGSGLGTRPPITPRKLDLYVAERVRELTNGTQNPVMVRRPDDAQDFPIARVR